jgi:ribosomal protein S12 methylthiotransferase accessory factor YcaO
MAQAPSTFRCVATSLKVAKRPRIVHLDTTTCDSRKSLSAPVASAIGSPLAQREETPTMDVQDCSYEYWLGHREMKYCSSGVTRSVRPRATIRRARTVLDTIGVTKVFDVTNLDRVGIPNFMTVRPHDLGPGISYYNGKGTTRADAHAGAMMEAVERHAGERYDGPVLAASHYNLRLSHACVDPLEIYIPMVRDYSEHLLLEWISGFDLLNRRQTFAPLNCVMSPYNPYSGMPLFYTSTNGLASGNTRLEALCHALCEVIERDATALAMAGAHLKPAISAILAEMGFSPSAPRDRGAPPLISLRGLPRRAASLVRKLQRAGLQVELRNLTSTTGIATIACTIAEPASPAAHGGCGTHPDARVALSRALTEAAQTRLTWIQGGREDLPELLPAGDAPAPEPSDGVSDTMQFDDLPSLVFPSVNEDVELLIERMRLAGFGQIVVFDITRAEVGIPVVRLVVPRAESWTFYCMHTGRGVFGDRVLRQIEMTGE